MDLSSIVSDQETIQMTHTEFYLNQSKNEASLFLNINSNSGSDLLDSQMCNISHDQSLLDKTSVLSAVGHTYSTGSKKKVKSSFQAKIKK